MEGRRPTVAQAARSVPVTVGKKVDLRFAVLQRYTLVDKQTEYTFEEMVVAEADGTIDYSKFLVRPLTMEYLAERVMQLEARIARLETKKEWRA